jgi:hypothetical protein
LVKIRRRVTNKFLSIWKEAFAAYQKGEWKEAKKLFEDSNRARGRDDQPSLNMLQIMKEANYQPPANWNGVRDVADI